MSDQPFTIGNWAQWSVYNGPATPCWYAGKTTVRCSHNNATHIVHDGRGCFHVCKAHCDWRGTTSTMQGHARCPEGKT